MERKEPGLWHQSQPGSAACCVTLGQAGNLVSLRCWSWEVGIIPSSQNHRGGSAGVRCTERCSWPSFGPLTAVSHSILPPTSQLSPFVINLEKIF